MGCCGGKSVPNENQFAAENKPLDLSRNPNQSISQNTNYYKNQSPGENDTFNDELFPHIPDTVFGKINGQSILTDS